MKTGAFFCQAVNPDDEILGFVIGWITALARRLERLEVVALEVRPARLPDNVIVHSLGRESGRSRLGRMAASQRILPGVMARSEFILAHMSPVFILAAAPWARLRGGKTALWYTHHNVDLKLRLAVAASDLVFTAASDTMRLDSPKKRVMGHGIDPDQFRPVERENIDGPLEVVSVGRISPRKKLETLIQAAEILEQRGRGGDFRFRLIGAPATAGQADYLAGLRNRLAESGLADRFEFSGHLPHAEVAGALTRADVFASMQNRTGFDKAVLEAMAAGLPALAAHPSYLEVMAEDAPRLFYGDAAEAEMADGLAERLISLADTPAEDRNRLGLRLRERVAREHDLNGLMGRIITTLSGLKEPTAG